MYKLGITEWNKKWIINNWQTSKKKMLKIKTYGLNYIILNKSLNVNWNWVKAHAGNPMNEEVDLMD